MPLFLRQLLAHPECFFPLAILATDLLLGDPQSWKWHPVRLLGRFAGYLEFNCRNRFPLNPFRAGVVAAILLISTALLSAFYLTNLLEVLLPRFLYLLSCVFICYFCIAVRDMIEHSRLVYDHLKHNEIPQARTALSMIVGRDTADLNEGEISRAAVESVAESFSDSFFAPMFYICLGLYFWGPAGAVMGGLLYRSVNTLDSMFGYKNERYIEFGHLSAKLDDVFNYLPARLSVIAISLGSMVCRLDFRQAILTAYQDGHHHSSPNSGYPEAAFAGSLGVQLGGDNYYGGLVRSSAKIGKPVNSLTSQTIHKANRLYLTSAVITSVLLAIILWW